MDTLSAGISSGTLQPHTPADPRMIGGIVAQCFRGVYGRRPPQCAARPTVCTQQESEEAPARLVLGVREPVWEGEAARALAVRAFRRLGAAEGQTDAAVSAGAPLDGKPLLGEQRAEGRVRHRGDLLPIRPGQVRPV